MKARLTRRRVLWILATCVAVVIVGYSSSATSLSQCNDATTPWLLEDMPAGWTATGHHAEPARLFLPFVATARYEKHFRVAPQEYSDEWGTRYYATLFGAVFPLGTTSESSQHIAD